MNVFDFEPHIDWDDISDEMATDLHRNVVALKRAQDRLLAYQGLPEGEGLRLLAANLLRAQQDLSTTAVAIQTTLYVVPMVVHVAGGRGCMTDDDGNEQVVQRCKRCGSVLQVWIEGFHRVTPEGPCKFSCDQFDWKKEGEIVAKAAHANAHRMYQIEDRELEEFERQCPDLTMLGT